MKKGKGKQLAAQEAAAAMVSALESSQAIDRGKLDRVIAKIDTRCYFLEGQSKRASREYKALWVAWAITAAWIFAVTITLMVS